MEMKEPYSDKYMQWDKLRKQYIPTTEALKRNIYVDKNIQNLLQDEDALKGLYREASDDIYIFIDKCTINSRVHYKRQWMHAVPEFRDILERAMCYQIRYNLRSGGGILKDMTGIDIERSRVISDRMKGRSAYIAEQSIELLESSGLLYQSGIDFQPLFGLTPYV